MPDERIGRIIPAGSDADLFLLGDEHLGVADDRQRLPRHRRAGAGAGVESATTKSSVAIPRGTYAHNPMVQHQIAEMYLELDAARPSWTAWSTTGEPASTTERCGA